MEEVIVLMKHTALIMAGGRGERFWPKSRLDLPKQFLSLTDDGITMIQHTVDRIKPIVSEEDIFIVTNENYADLVHEQLPNIPEENVIYEPVGRNTAPCIGLGALYIQKKYEDAIMIVLPSDHLIKNNKLFIRTIKDAIKTSEQKENLVTLGITPEYPETGYGYIKFDEKEMYENAYHVEAFVEKPDVETAKDYIKTEQYLWNSGIFVWKLSSILKNYKEYLPESFDTLMKIKEFIGEEKEKSVINEQFPKMESISIDYGIMERAKDVYVCPCSFGWDDVGSWLAVERIQTQDEFGNVIQGNTITVDTNNTIIQGGQRLIATVGVEGLIVVDTNDSLLVCNKNSTGEIKKVIENLRICNKLEYL